MFQLLRKQERSLEQLSQTDLPKDLCGESRITTISIQLKQAAISGLLRFNLPKMIRQQYQTYVKVAGAWCYLYRAIDRDGTLVDVYLSETRDMAAAKAFLRSARSVTQVEPEQVTTDGHTSYPRAIAEEFGTAVDHRTSQYKNNVLEQDHRGIKRRYRSMRGFKAFGSADRFCRAFDETSSARPATSTRTFRWRIGARSTSGVSPRCET
jgi:hypothetical protein